MKAKFLLALTSLSALTLTGCNSPFHYEEHLADYCHALRYRDGFNILQLTDIHWNANTSTIASKRYLDKVFAATATRIGSGNKIDLVEVTGDQFMLANTYHVTTFLEYFEAKAQEYGFSYAVIWGNHDRHGLYNPNWLSDQFNKAAHCIYNDLEDDLYGRSNFIINLTEDGTTSGATKWQIANLDSGASFSETAVSPFRDYDYIRKDQTQWWLKEHALVGDTVPTIAYYHIPQQDNLEAWNAIHNNNKTYKHKFFKLEGFADNGNREYASDFIAEGRKHHLKAAFMGHAHNVDWTVDYDGVVIGLGVKTGPELYYAHVSTEDKDPAVQEGYASIDFKENFDLIGASMVTLHDGEAFDLQHLYLNERATGDFVKWVNW